LLKKVFPEVRSLQKSKMSPLDQGFVPGDRDRNRQTRLQKGFPSVAFSRRKNGSFGSLRGALFPRDNGWRPIPDQNRDAVSQKFRKPVASLPGRSGWIFVPISCVHVWARPDVFTIAGGGQSGRSDPAALPQRVFPGKLPGKHVQQRSKANFAGIKMQTTPAARHCRCGESARIGRSEPINNAAGARPADLAVPRREPGG